MRHYCTYFDAGFLAQGLALWASLKRHDATAVLWVLALDGDVERTLQALSDPRLRVVPLARLEADDGGLLAVKSSRSRAEYCFTLSPCWPRWILLHAPEVERVAYLDADLYFFGDPGPIWEDLSRGDVLVTAHRFPAFLAHYERHGHFNVGVLGWTRSTDGLACLDDWRRLCLDWCHDRLEPNRYADQKYLDRWPSDYRRVVECRHPGVNLAPWNWLNHDVVAMPDGQVLVDGQPLIVFHFARFRPIAGRWLWQSGQLDYGIMDATLRNAIYGPYVRALDDALGRLPPGSSTPRGGRTLWKALPLRVLFGSDWFRVGDAFVSGRLGLGHYSGRFLAWARTAFFRR